MTVTTSLADQRQTQALVGLGIMGAFFVSSMWFAWIAGDTNAALSLLGGELFFALILLFVTDDWDRAAA